MQRFMIVLSAALTALSIGFELSGQFAKGTYVLCMGMFMFIVSKDFK